MGQRVRRLAAEHPDWTQAELAAAAGCSDRTVRRHLAAHYSYDRRVEELVTALRD